MTLANEFIYTEEPTNVFSIGEVIDGKFTGKFLQVLGHLGMQIAGSPFFAFEDEASAKLFRTSLPVTFETCCYEVILYQPIEFDEGIWVKA